MFFFFFSFFFCKIVEQNTNLPPKFGINKIIFFFCDVIELLSKTNSIHFKWIIFPYNCIFLKSWLKKRKKFGENKPWKFYIFNQKSVCVCTLQNVYRITIQCGCAVLVCKTFRTSIIKIIHQEKVNVWNFVMKIKKKKVKIKRKLFIAQSVVARSFWFSFTGTNINKNIKDLRGMMNAWSRL